MAAPPAARSASTAPPEAARLKPPPSARVHADHHGRSVASRIALQTTSITSAAVSAAGSRTRDAWSAIGVTAMRTPAHSVVRVPKGVESNPGASVSPTPARAGNRRAVTSLAPNSPSSTTSPWESSGAPESTSEPSSLPSSACQAGKAYAASASFRGKRSITTSLSKALASPSRVQATISGCSRIESSGPGARSISASTIMTRRSMTVARCRSPYRRPCVPTTDRSRPPLVR